MPSVFAAGSTAGQEAQRIQAVMPAASRLAAALLDWWGRPDEAPAHQLELAQVAAARACAYLRCANVGAEGGPAAGEGAGSMKCSGCRVAWYCNAACQLADWRDGGHRRVCKALAAARLQERERAGS